MSKDGFETVRNAPRRTSVQLHARVNDQINWKVEQHAKRNSIADSEKRVMTRKKSLKSVEVHKKKPVWSTQATELQLERTFDEEAKQQIIEQISQLPD